MSTLVLNGLEPDNPLFALVSEEVKARLPEPSGAAWFDLHAMTIGYCNGCGFCGDKKPGVCCKRDQMQEIYPRLARTSWYSVLRCTFTRFRGRFRKF